MKRLLAIFSILLALPAHADTINDVPQVVDGDSLVINGIKIRLHGIDALELDQICGTYPNQWDCGRKSSRALREIIDCAPVTCQERDVDRNRRIVSVSTAGGMLPNARMVVDGGGLLPIGNTRWTTLTRKIRLVRAAEESGRVSLSGQRIGVVGSGLADLVPRPIRTLATCRTITAVTLVSGRKHSASTRLPNLAIRTDLTVIETELLANACADNNRVAEFSTGEIVCLR